MCGINLIIDKKKQLPPLITSYETSPISRMINRNRHRGPDHQNAIHQEGNHWNVFMGSNRLKIIGVEDTANQPFAAENNQYFTLYNGAIYNYQDLRNELLVAGERFTSQSDTEVLSKLLIQKAEAAIPKLNGMFAFAFYDVQAEMLLLGRDPSGMKPLFYYEDESYFIVASEITSILASGLVIKALNTDQVVHYLQYKYASYPATFFENIYEFQPGSYASIVPEGVITMMHYDRCSSSQSTINLFDHQAILDNTETLLSDAILRHLLADVPCGLFLSGGVDSTLILALIKKLGAHPIDTFSIVSDGSEHSFGTQDTKYSRLAAKQYGNYHHEVPINAGILDDIPDFIQYLDQPIADSATILTFQLAREAKKKVGVVLSGAGADELFGGYYRHSAYLHYLKHYPFYSRYKGAIQLITRYLPTGFHHPFRSRFRLIKKFGQSLSTDPKTTYLNFVCSSFFSEEKTSSPMFSFSEDFIDQHLAQALHHDLDYYLVSDILALSDRMSMAHSLEMRMPFLDAEVVEFSHKLPPAFKLHNGKKWILKSLLSRLGGKCYTRRKEGFGLPFGAWLHNENAFRKIHPYLKDEQLLIYQFVSYNKAQKLLQQHREHQEDHSLQIWSLLTLSAWLEVQFARI